MYGFEVVPGALRSLRLDAPTEAAPPLFASIALAWQRRWLMQRVTHADALLRVARSGPEVVKASLSAPDSSQRDLFVQTPTEAPEKPPTATRRTFMPRQPRLDLLQQLYRDSGAVADHHDEDTVDALHISTKLDGFIRDRAKEGCVIFVTGNPGDGKTHLLKRLSAELRAANAEVNLDANECDDKALIASIERAMRSKRGYVVAINEGILVELAHKAGKAEWADEVRRQLLRPHEYLRPQNKRVEEDARDPGRVVVVDLNQRNTLAPEIVAKALAKLLSFAAPSPGCPGPEKCTIQFNATRLADEEVAQRLADLLGAVARTGFHATMRDLHGFIAYAIVGDRRCDDAGSADVRPYWENIFSGGEGPLFEAVRRLDPRHHSLPVLDDLLWRGAETDKQWFLAVPPRLMPASLADRVHGFVSQKRRALFEHRDGARILEQTGSEAERSLSSLISRQSQARDVVRLLNKFFDKDDSTNVTLRLWHSHRYDARPSRYSASAADVPSQQLEIRVPQPRALVKAAFEDYRPDHVLLSERDAAAPDGLRVDMVLLEALLAAEQGLPATFRRSEPEARVAAFFDRLAAKVEEQGATSEVRFVDMNSGANLTLHVNIADRRYTGSGR